MARLAGEWGPPTISGPDEIETNGVAHKIPKGSKIKLVTAHGGVEVAHVKTEGMVFVLSALGQFREPAREARARVSHWSEIAGD